MIRQQYPRVFDTSPRRSQPMQIPAQTQHFFALVFLCGCFLAGCDALGGGDNLCEGRDGLFIQTDRSSYQFGDEAMVTTENCTGERIFLDGGSSPDYELEKRIGDAWEVLDGQGGLYPSFEEIEAGKDLETTFPVEPDRERADRVAGTYRFELDIHDSQKNPLPKARRRSNTFEIVE